jgi:hypothetical protein
VPYTDPERARDYQRQYRRSARAGEPCTTAGTTLPVEFRLQTAQDVIDLLQEQIGAVRDEKKAKTLEKARAIGYLASIALRAIETGNLAARLEAMEAVLKQRKGDGRKP